VRGQPTGNTLAFSGDTVATAKRDLKPGEKLDGEGGHMVYGKLMPAVDSLNAEALPIGLAHHIVLQRPVAAGQTVRWSDVAIDSSLESIRIRREMEELFRKEMGLTAPRSSIAA